MTTAHHQATASAKKGAVPKRAAGPAPSSGGANQAGANAIAGGLVGGLAKAADAILNFPADGVAMQDHTPPAYQFNLSGAWDTLWENRTGIQPGSLNDWLLHKTATATGIATLVIPGIDAVSGAADAIRGLSAARALADGLTIAAPEEDLPALTAARSALEAKFKHAAAFGVTEARGAAGFDAYRKAVSAFVNDSSTVRVLGTYRGNSAILNYNSESSLVVVQSPSGGFVSGWQMSQEQLQNVIERGSLGGG